MPKHGMRWRHVIINTKCSWLHGDPRGFRSRDHRIHSTGDYKRPPPPGEHQDLRNYMRERARPCVIIPQGLRVPMLQAIVCRLKKEGFTVLTASVGANHAHALTELPDDPPVIRQIIGRCKRSSCEAVKQMLPGSIWSAGGDFVPVDNRSHHHRAFNYIYEEQEPDAATWSYRDDIYRPPRKIPGRR
jgi:hypothetical protein